MKNENLNENLNENMNVKQNENKNLNLKRNDGPGACNPAETDGYIVKHLEVEKLPLILQKALSISKEPAMQDMLLLSTLTALSYALPAFTTIHGKPGKRYMANLMTMILAPAASGKGIMSYSKLLLHDLHEQLRNASEQDAPQKMVFIPCNSSAAAFIQQLSNNEGQGLAFANEMDTLSQMWKSSYGKFSDVLRCAFEHETIGLRRRTFDEYIEVENPCLSVLISGTYNQLLPLMRSRENGLTSRFGCYVVKDLLPFDTSVFDEAELEKAGEAEQLYRELGHAVKLFYEWQLRQNGTCQFCYTSEQSQRLSRMMMGQWQSYVTEETRDFDSSVKRMGVIIKRIGMILAAFRLDITQPLPEKLYCTEDDFRVLTVVLNKMLLHASWMYEMLPSQKQEVGRKYITQNQEQQQQYLRSLPQTFSRTEAMQLADEYGICQSTATKWVTAQINAGAIVREAHGQYKKVA